MRRQVIVRNLLPHVILDLARLIASYDTYSFATLKNDIHRLRQVSLAKVRMMNSDDLESEKFLAAYLKGESVPVGLSSGNQTIYSFFDIRRIVNFNKQALSKIVLNVFNNMNSEVDFFVREYKLKAITDFNAVGEYSSANKMSLLFRSVYRNKYALVKCLLDLGVAINHQDQSGLTALMVAAQNPALYGILQLLLANGADAALLDKHGYTALTHATETENENAIFELSKQKPVFSCLSKLFPVSEIRRSAPIPIPARKQDSKSYRLPSGW